MRMFVMLLTGLWMLSMAAWASAAAPAPADPDGYLRPITSVPQMKRPVIDGNMIKGEWNVAARLHDLVSLNVDDGFAASEPTQVWISYDEEMIHIAFRMHMAAGVAPNMTEPDARDAGFNDDAFDLFLAPDDGAGAVYQVGLSAGNAMWDRKIDASTDSNYSWNSDCKYKAVIDAGNNWWTGEIAIPWKSMGRSMPADGEVWRANFIANRRAPTHRVDCWSYWTKWRDFANNGRLIFASRRPAFQMMAQTHEAFGGSGVWPAVLASYDTLEQPRPVEYSVKLYRRGDDGMSFLRELRKRRNEATGEAATFATFEQDLQNSLKDYAILEQLTKIEHCPPKGFTGAWGGRWKVQEAGDYVLMYHLRDMSDPAAPQEIAAGTVPFRVRVGVQAELHPFVLTRRAVVVRSDLRAVPQRAKVTQIRTRITAGDERTLVEKTVPATQEPKQEWEVSIADLPRVADKPYDVHVEALDAQDAVLSAAKAPLLLPPDPDWWVNREVYGSTPEVPWPWTPITLEGKTAQVWGRQLSFGDSALPDVLINQGEKVLAAPIDFELRVAGKVVPLRGSSEVLESRPGHVLLRSVRSGAGVKLTITSKLEFDGFSLVDVSIEPTGAPVAIDGLDFVIAVRPEHGEFLTMYRNAPGPGKLTPRYVGKMPQQHIGPVFYTAWLGNDHGGFEWICDNTRGWYMTKPDEAWQVRKLADRVESRWRVIDASLTLAAKREIRFGMIPTPVKPIPRERVDLQSEFFGFPPPLPGVTKVKSGAIATQKDLDDWHVMFKEADMLCMLLWAQWTGEQNRFWHAECNDPKQIELIRQQEQIARAAGKYLLWNGGWAIAPYVKDWHPWGQEMVALPLTPTFANQFDHTYTSPFVEFMVGSYAKNVAKMGIGGIRFDTVFPWKVSENPWLGETWSSDVPAQKGQVYGTIALFRQREMAKRLYRIFNPEPGKPPVGLINHGIAGPPIMSVEGFTDTHDVGEGIYEHATMLKDGYQQDMARVWFVGRPYGLVFFNNLKGKSMPSIQRMTGLLVAGADPRLSLRSDAATYTPNSPVQTPTRKLWRAFRWIDRAQAQWWPHWKNKSHLTTSGAGEHYVSFYLRPGQRVLLIVANYEPAPQRITVELNLQAMGFPADATLQAVDAVTGAPYAFQGRQLAFDLEPQLFRLVQVMLPGDEP